jgi:hypothetical protein
VLSVLFYYLGLNFSLVLLLALVYLSLYTLSVLACYRPLAVGKHLNKGIELMAAELKTKMNKALNYYYFAL